MCSLQFGKIFIETRNHKQHDHIHSMSSKMYDETILL